MPAHQRTVPGPPRGAPAIELSSSCRLSATMANLARVLGEPADRSIRGGVDPAHLHGGRFDTLPPPPVQGRTFERCTCY
jgi:hypothetical protein